MKRTREAPSRPCAASRLATVRCTMVQAQPLHVGDISGVTGQVMHSHDAAGARLSRQTKLGLSHKILRSIKA